MVESKMWFHLNLGAHFSTEHNSLGTNLPNKNVRILLNQDWTIRSMNT